MPILEARGVGQTYGAVVALDEVSLSVEAGSVHALLGENGAGKSTLVKIMSGAIAPGSGRVLLDGKPVRFRTTAEAARRGVAVVSQELNLFPDLDVLANLFPKRELRRGPFLDRRAMTKAARPVLEQLGIDTDPRTPVGRLPLAERQLLEIARALLADPRVLILDEPTSALDRTSTDRLLHILRVLKQRTVGVLFVSHILEDVMAHSDVITVLRDGRTVMDAEPRSRLSIDAVVKAMLGERVRQVKPAEDVASAITSVSGDAARLSLTDVTAKGRLTDVSLTAGPGEIVGLAGLTGAGHQAVLELVAGLRRADAGRIRLPSGRAVPRGLPGCINAGVALVSGDRRRLGLMLDKPIWENIAQVRSIALGRDGILIRRAVLRARARTLAERLGLRYATLDQRAGLLSGGNQQKVVFAKWLDANPSVLLLDDPTRGVDVGARAEMHGLIRAVSRAGAIVLLCSTDLDELATTCDRVVVFFQSRAAVELSGDDLTEHRLLEAMNTGYSSPTADIS